MPNAFSGPECFEISQLQRHTTYRPQ